jgi:hypothetical protein
MAIIVVVRIFTAKNRELIAIFSHSGTPGFPNRYTATMSRTPERAVRTREDAKNLLALVGKYPFEKKNRLRIATRPNAKKSPIRFILSLQGSSNTEV